jgi:TatD DNase family protein
MNIIDSHCHCHYSDFSFFQDEIFQRNSLIFLLNVATKGDDSKIWVEKNFSHKNNKIYHYKNKISLGYSVGFHPCEESLVHKESLNNMVNNAIAIGEIGFDNGEQSPSMDHQKINFHTQMAIATDHNLPVLIHCRDAWNIFFEETKNYKNHPMVIHCFTGDKNVALKLINEYNCLISMSGVITYKKAEEIRESLHYIPLERLLVETDSPFLTPFNYRKEGHKENNPTLILETIEKIAEIKNIEVNEVIKNTTENFLKFFKIDNLMEINEYSI